ncbi:MAG: hypothetical protein ACTHMY_16725 [Solirubrobacteraceae bacterium]
MSLLADPRLRAARKHRALDVAGFRPALSSLSRFPPGAVKLAL